MSTTFDDVRLPEDVETGAKGGPSFLTSTITLSGGLEQRIGNWEQPRQPWDVGYGVQSDDDFNLVREFFYARRGKLRSFRFRDWSDYQARNEQIGVGDGTTRTFLLGKTYDVGGPLPFFRRITRPVTGTVVVYVDGVAADVADYDVHIAGGYVRFHVDAVPPNTKVVRADCDFDIPVRFDTDTFDLTLFWFKAGQVPHLPVMEIRDIINDPPTVTLINSASPILETHSTASHVRVADVLVDDDPFGEDSLSLSGADAVFFELVGTLNSDGGGVSLYLKAGTTLNTDTKSSYAVTVNVSDPTLSTVPLDHADYTLTITPVEAAPTLTLTNLHASLAWNEDTTARIRVADVNVLQHHPSATANTLALTGADATHFELGTASGTGAYTTQLYIKAGTSHAVDINTPLSYSVTVGVSNADFSSPPQDSKSMTVTFGAAGSTFIDDVPGTRGWVVPEYTTLVVEGYAGGAGAAGTNALGNDGGNTSITSMSLLATGGKTSPLQVGGFYNTQGGAGGVATGGDENDAGGNGGNGFAKARVAIGSSVTSGAGGAAKDGTGSAAVSATPPAAPYIGDPCSPAPPAGYPVPGTSASIDGTDGAHPGDGGAGAAIADWELVLSLATGYCWETFQQGRPGAGAGSHFKKTFTRSVTAGAPTPGDTITYTVAAKGAGGSDVASGGDGSNGRIKFVVS